MHLRISSGHKKNVYWLTWIQNYTIFTKKKYISDKIFRDFVAYDVDCLSFLPDVSRPATDIQYVPDYKFSNFNSDPSYINHILHFDYVKKITFS